jgi:succinate dehydrogenase/fumarate reductase flavoprotein subunit
MMSGNALVARLAKTAFDLGIPIWLDAPAVELINENGRVVGALIKQKGQMVNVMARLGVVLAAGGFPHDLERRKKLYAHAPTPSEHYSLASPGNNGEGISMAESVGGHIAPGYSNAAAWMPVSRVTYRDGSSGIYPHSFERGKPGVIAVNSAGTRFTNESDSYHDVVRAMIDAKTSRTKGTGDQPIAAFLVCDTRFIRRYGLGIAKPFPMPLSHWLRSGYLLSGNNLETLASKMDVDAVALRDTITAFNNGAAIGTDPLYRRGDNAYNRYLGDKDYTPNPCLAPITQAPFYAVKILPGDLGTFMGLATDRDARVLDLQGAPIDGLYAVGTDMASIFGGSYPGPGANLGPAMTFGFLCAEHIARKHNEK